MIYLIAAALILVFVPAVLLAKLARTRIRDYQRQLHDAIEEAEHAHTELLAQSGLEQTIDMLRAKLYALGRPRRAGDELYFGDTLINGNCAIVDDVKILCGGVAAVFSGDQRVATNVLNPDHSRATGTRLARGLAFDRVLGEGLSYHGEADIFGVPHLTIYEPILAAGEVIGVISAGIKKSPVVLQAARDDITVSVTALKAVLEAQAETLHRRLAARRDAQDGLRRLQAA